MSDYTIETKKKITPEEFEGIYRIEVDFFPPKQRESSDDLREILANPKGIHLVLKVKGRTAGYATALPYEEAYQDYLKQHDQELRPDPSALYLESFAVVEQERQLSKAADLFKQLVREARKQGFRSIVTHAQVGGLLGQVIHEHVAWQSHRVENWYDFGGTFIFWEYAIPD